MKSPKVVCLGVHLLDVLVRHPEAPNLKPGWQILDDLRITAAGTAAGPAVDRSGNHLQEGHRTFARCQAHGADQVHRPGPSTGRRPRRRPHVQVHAVGDDADGHLEDLLDPVGRRTADRAERRRCVLPPGQPRGRTRGRRVNA